MSRTLTDLSDIRENICFYGMGCCELMQLTIFFFSEDYFKRYYLYIRWNFKINKPSLRYVQFNKYHQTTLFFEISSIYRLIILIYELIMRKDSSNFTYAIHKITIFSSTILLKSPNVFSMELIFRFKRITLLR